MSKLPNPIEYVEYVMDQMNLIQADLVRAGCGQRSHVSEMVNGRRRFSIKFIRKFLELTHRENMAHIMIQDYKLRK